MDWVASVWGLFRLAIMRLQADPGLTVGILLGLVTTVALTTSVPIYVEAANNRILRRELGKIEGRGSPAFAFMYHVAYHSEAIRPEEFHAADAYLSQQVPALFRLPPEELTLSVQSKDLELFPASAEFYDSPRRALANVKVGFVRGLSDHSQVVEGRWPAIPASPADGRPTQNEGHPDEPIEVLIAQSQVETLGVQVGEAYTLFKDSDRFGRVQFPIRIAGIWVPSEPGERFWFLSPDVYEDVLLVPEESYVRRIMSIRNLVPGKDPWALDYIAWYQVFDGSKVTAEDVPGLLARMRRAKATLKGMVSSIGVSVSPEWALLRHQKDVKMQGNLLLTFGIPIIVIVLVSTAFISAVSVQRRSSEIALLRSRGMSEVQVLVLCLFQSLILGSVALALGLFAAKFVAQLLGSTRAFLSFETSALAQKPLTVVVTPSSFRVGGIVVSLASVFYLLPAIDSARLTVVTFWRNAVRTIGRPWWQRSFLDVVLFVSAGYGYYLLKGGHSLSFLMGGQGNPFERPLILITPSLYLLVGVLFFLRIAPYLLDSAAWLFNYLPGTVLVLTLRHLARRVKAYGGVLVLLTYSISLSLFTASMAWTLDKNLEHRAYYRVGSHLNVQERGWGEQELAETIEGTGGDTTTDSDGDKVRTFYVVPVDEALQIGGIEAATRVYRFGAMVRSSDSTGKGTLMGIDRLSFPTAAFFRSDFASRSLGALMNSLAADRSGVLVDRDTSARYRLSVGDSIRVQLSNTEATKIVFRIVGIVDLFPTVQRHDFPLFVGSADYILEHLGASVPGQLWLTVHPSVDAQTVFDQIRDAGFRASSMVDARALIKKEQEQLLRVGLLGFLSVGFVAVSALSFLSLIIYSFTSFQQRAIQFGILQAIGLTKAQLEWAFILEQFVLIALGAIVGTVLGLHGCRLFLPFFQISYESTFPLPPPLIVIAWRDIWKVYVILGVTHLVLAAGALRVLKSLRVFEAIKLGAQSTG